MRTIVEPKRLVGVRQWYLSSAYMRLRINSQITVTWIKSYKAEVET